MTIAEDLNSRVRVEVDASDVLNAISNHSAQTGTTTGWSADTGITLAAVASAPSRNRINLDSYDPGFEAATYLGGSGGGALTVKDTTWVANGTRSIKTTAQTGGNTAASAYPWSGSAGTNMPRSGMQPGRTYTVSATCRLTAALTGTLSSASRSIILHRFDGGVLGAVIAQSPQAPNAAGVTRLSVTVTIPADCTDFVLRLYHGSATVGESVWWDSLLVEGGTGTGLFTESLTGLFTGGKAIRATYASATAALYGGVYTPSVSVVPGQYVGVQFGFADSARPQTPDFALKCETSVYFYDSGGNLLPGSLMGGQYLTYPTGWQVETSTYRSASIFPDQKAPVGAASMRVKIMFFDEYKPDQVRDEINRAVYITKMMIVLGTTINAVKNVPFPLAETWQNLLGSSISVNLDRGGEVSGVTDEIEAGIITATILDASVDPSANTRIRPGRKMRVTACQGDPAADPFVPLFTGKIADVDVDYSEGKGDTNPRPRIVITGTDAVAEMRNIPSPYNYSGNLGSKTRALMAASTVPFATDSGTISTTKTSLNEGASLWDQLLLARNSIVNAKVYVDKSGTLQSKVFGVASLIPNPGFETDLAGWTFQFATVTRDTTTFDSGLASAKLVANGTGRPRIQTSGFIAMQPGQVFTITANMKTSGALSQGYAVVAEAYDAAGTYLTEFSSAPFTNLPIWTAQTLEFTAPASATQCIIYILLASASSTSTTDTIWLDSITAKTGKWTFSDEASASLSYTAIQVNFGSKSLVNQLVVNRTNIDEGEEGSKAYGPYLNGTSVAAWGTVSADLDVIDGVPADLAVDLLSKYATPSAFPAEVTFDALDPGAWAGLVAFCELYDRVRVKKVRSGVDLEVLVLSIHQEITPDSWRVSLGFRPIDTTITATVTNASGAMSAGPADLILPTPGPLGSRRSTTTQAITTGIFTSVDFNSAVVTDGGVTWSTVDRRFTVPKAGRWQVNAAVTFAANSTGRRVIRPLVNATNIGEQVEATPGSQVMTLTYSRVIKLAANDTVGMSAYHTVGADLNLRGDSNCATLMDLTWIGL